jgi:ABC-type dipeptide/oligopeptide/nickel transport system permease component
MTQLIAKRLVAMGAVLLALTAIVFLLQKLSPINPVHSYLGANASAGAIKVESKLLGYNRPIADQYLRYVGNLLRGNLGESLRTRRQVTTDLGAYLPATLELASFGLLLSVMLGAMLGLRRRLLPSVYAPRRIYAAVPAGAVRAHRFLPRPQLASRNRSNEPCEPTNGTDSLPHR